MIQRKGGEANMKGSRRGRDLKMCGSDTPKRLCHSNFEWCTTNNINNLYEMPFQQQYHRLMSNANVTTVRSFTSSLSFQHPKKNDNNGYSSEMDETLQVNTSAAQLRTMMQQNSDR